MKSTRWMISLIAAICCTSATLADNFGTTPNNFDIQFVNIGDPGNPADTTGNPNPAGSVDYAYRISKYEISSQMIDKANLLGGLGITHYTYGPDKPATDIDWYEAALFVNWLNTSSGYAAAYKFDGGGNFQLWSPGDAGYDPTNLYRNSLAVYVLPSIDEWYKAAYYNPAGSNYYDYPTASNTAPTAVTSGTAAGTAVFDHQSGPADVEMAGGPSPYGVVGQAGNVFEWNETDFDLVNDSTSSNRVLRGGDWTLDASVFTANSWVGLDPAYSDAGIGFRVAAVPEPASATLIVLGGFALLLRKRRAENDV